MFDDGRYTGDHNSFTQCEQLVEYERFEEWFIGASGPIADSQLADYNSKSSRRGKS